MCKLTTRTFYIALHFLDFIIFPGLETFPLRLSRGRHMFKDNQGRKRPAVRRWWFVSELQARARHATRLNRRTCIKHVEDREARKTTENNARSRLRPWDGQKLTERDRAHGGFVFKVNPSKRALHATMCYNRKANPNRAARTQCVTEDRCRMENASLTGLQPRDRAISSRLNGDRAILHRCRPTSVCKCYIHIFIL